MCGARSWKSVQLEVLLLRSVHSRLLLPVWGQNFTHSQLLRLMEHAVVVFQAVATLNFAMLSDVSCNGMRVVRRLKNRQIRKLNNQPVTGRTNPPHGAWPLGPFGLLGSADERTARRVRKANPALHMPLPSSTARGSIVTSRSLAHATAHPDERTRRASKRRVRKVRVERSKSKRATEALGKTETSKMEAERAEMRQQ